MAFSNAIRPAPAPFPAQQAAEPAIAVRAIAPQAARGPGAATGRLAPPEPFDASHGTAKLPPHLRRENGGQFALGQNYPNPYVDQTTIPFTLAHGGDVRLDLFDSLGRKMAGIARKGLSAGDQTIPLNLTGLGLPPGEYDYQLQVSNLHGVYWQSKTMTAG